MKSGGSQHGNGPENETTPPAQFFVRLLHEDETRVHARLLDTAFAPLHAIYVTPPRPPRSPSSAWRTVVAEMDGRIVGATSYYFRDDQVRLAGVAVEPDFRRRGVARALIQWVVDNVCSEMHPTVGLYTIEETGNPRIFEKIGFRTVSRRVATGAASPSGGPVHEVDMVLEDKDR